MEQIKRNQSSVEWLFEQIARRQGSILQTIPFYDDNQDLLQQAKAMHKEEMIEFSQEVFRNRYNQVYQSLGSIADDKYKETFGGNNESN
jgi:hypothetical protein